MDDNIWKDIELEEIKHEELTEKEKKLAEEFAEIQLEFDEAISMITEEEEK